MRLTFALGMNPDQYKLFNEINPPNALVSFAYAKILEGIKYTPEYLILDSGAFTAWSTGKQVDVVAYAEWALANANRGKEVVAVNLDVIPGEMGRTSTKEERNEGMARSLKNADYLRSRGLNVMEVFHQDEPLVFLDTLLDRLPPNGILAISPRNDVAMSSKLEWQKIVLRHLYQRYGKNLPRTHGLAVTSHRMMKGFPYYSVDSSTWASAMRFGTYTNEWGKQEHIEKIYDGRPNTVNMKPAIIHSLRKSIENYGHVEKSMTTLWAQRGVTWKN